jgi:hypothetical protein
VMYTWTQRTSADAGLLPVDTCSLSNSPVGCIQTPYQLNSGNLLRFQLQWNF